MNIELKTVTVKERDILWNILQLCLHDYTEFEPFEMEPDGRFAHRWFDAYFVEACRHAFLIQVNGNLGGFVLVREGDESEDWEFQIAEFFILRRYRRSGLGTAVAKKVLARFTGLWEISYSTDNRPAVKFWKSFAGLYPNAEFQEYYGEESRSRYRIRTG